eukprot:4595393-Amphidinium_carterae.1
MDVNRLFTCVFKPLGGRSSKQEHSRVNACEAESVPHVHIVASGIGCAVCVAYIQQLDLRFVEPRFGRQVASQGQRQHRSLLEPTDARGSALCRHPRLLELHSSHIGPRDAEAKARW